MKRIFAILFLCLVSSLSLFAQADKKDVREGNRKFKKGSWAEAEIGYRKALVKDSTSLAANYNLANTMYREGLFQDAAGALEKGQVQAGATETAADYYYNKGDIAIAQEDWQGAVDAFKQSLLLRPDDMDAKENYAYAKMMLQDQENEGDGGGGGGGQDQDQNQDEQNRQDQGDDEQQDQNQDQNQGGQDQQDRDQGQEQEQEAQISPQQAQQILQAIQAKEQETQEKVDEKKAEAFKSRQKDKNW